ncbi:hypothetical protein KJ781_02075 [Patescibacteria group bacterium]|nr:hypothetical protein [Patescibacteria group bacterium]MBU1448641.1 hypothetical protein [Patescibacteria group bacterium]MBU2613505.1 hypothetical protein [Patescibacteria group bacterium]
MPHVNVRASEGIGRVSVAYPFGGRKVFVAMEPHVLHRESRTVTVPAGVMYLLHQDLVRRTKGKVKHALVEQGLYHLLRLTEHVRVGTRFETAEMIERRSDILDAARFLLESGYATDEEYAQVKDAINGLALQFGVPKRRKEKLAAADRLNKAQALRASVDRRKIAPSSMTAYAAGKQVAKRIANLPRIGGYFSGCGLRVCVVIRETEKRIERLWKFFGPPKPGEVAMLDDLMDTIDRLDESDLGRVVRKAGFTSFADSMRTISCRPYRPLALAVADHVDALGRAVREREKGHVLALGQEIRGMVRQMRMIGYLETQLIGRISTYLDRMPSSRRSVEDPARAAIRERVVKVSTRLRDLGPDDMDYTVLLEAKALFMAAEARFAVEDLEGAKERLKDMTSALANVPVLSDHGVDAARAS